MGLRSKPIKITVNENSQSVDGSKTVWDEINSVYHVNLQTEVKKKVLLDTEYLSFRWTGGFELQRKIDMNSNDNNNNNKNNNFFFNPNPNPNNNLNDFMFKFKK
jgi:hypothetical protein